MNTTLRGTRAATGADRTAVTRAVRTPTVRPGSTSMYALQEALARDRMRERERSAHRSQLCAELAAVHRWQYVSERARRAAVRHAARASQAAVQ